MRLENLSGAVLFTIANLRFAILRLQKNIKVFTNGCTYGMFLLILKYAMRKTERLTESEGN